MWVRIKIFSKHKPGKPNCFLQNSYYQKEGATQNRMITFDAPHPPLLQSSKEINEK